MLKEGGPSRKRKAPQEVTSNACTECRRKRAKCDGKKPCSRCASREGLECVYDVHLRTAKQTMKTEIDKLRAQTRVTNRILQALASGEQTEVILAQLKNNEVLQTIVDSLRPEPLTSTLETGDTERDEEEAEAEWTLDETDAEDGSPKSSKTKRGKERLHPPWSGPSDEVHSKDSSQADTTFSTGLSMSRSMSAVTLTTPSNASNDAFTGEADVDMEDLGRSPLSSWGAAQFSPYRPSRVSSERQIHESDETSIRSATDVFGGDEAAAQKSLQDLEKLSQALNNEMDLDAPPALRASLGDRISRAPWTNVVQDEKIVQHLLNLYFCWEYPTFASLSRKHFFHDYYEGNRQFCSSLLVNALLSLGARFSKSPIARGDAGGQTVGEQFFEECKRLLEADNGEPCLPTVQALGLMSLREASCGRNVMSLTYSRRSMHMALEMQLEKDLYHLNGVAFTETEREVRAATFWGCFTLEQAWSLCLGRVPQVHRSIVHVHKPAVIEEIEQQEWIPYKDEGLPVERNWIQPSNIRSVYMSFCELSEVVHDTLFTIYRPDGHLTSQKILGCYTKFLGWYSALPDALRLGRNFTPSVLFTHMYYHFALLLLFRPFIKLVFIGSAVAPREICTQAAESISSLVRSYYKLYTLACTPSFVPYIVLTASITHLLDGNTVLGPAYFLKGMSDLHDMCDCHGFARRSIEILRYLAKKWAPSMPCDESAVNEHGDSVRPPTPLSVSTMDFFTLISDESLPKLEGTNVITAPNSALFAIFANQGIPRLRATLVSQPGVEIEDRSREMKYWLNRDGLAIANESFEVSDIPDLDSYHEDR